MFDTRFRLCIRGEERLNNQCVRCPFGKYSLSTNSSVCQLCPVQADCPGGDQISLKQGFWRSSFDTMQIHSCLFTLACNGGTGQNVSGTMVPYSCAPGYGGNLCHDCREFNGTRYSRFSKNQCLECSPSQLINFFKIIGVILLLFILLMGIINMNLQRKRKNEASVLFRILTNYFQVFASLVSFNLAWPDAMSDIFRIFTTVGETSSMAVSFDCFLESTSHRSNRLFFQKMALVAFMPLILIIIITGHPGTASS